jgi:hypothetical protein
VFHRPSTLEDGGKCERNGKPRKKETEEKKKMLGYQESNQELLCEKQ